MEKEVKEIRWHGRGGQGVKTAATLFAQVALHEGKFGQGFPEYGPERMGAPIAGYTRISNSEIRVHSAIRHPDIVVVLDDTLLDTAAVLDGLSDEVMLVVNTTGTPAEVRKQTGLSGGKVFTVNASQIATDEIGRPIPNTPMLGALVKVSDVIKRETVIADIKKKFAKKFSQKIVDGNVNAIQRAYEEVRGE